MLRNIVLPSTALLLSCALQGCVYSALPQAVQIAIGHECDAKAQDLPEEEVLKLVAGLKKCDDLDAAKLEVLGVGCEQIIRGFLDTVMTVECERVVAEAVYDKCGDQKTPVPDGCKEAVTSSVNEFKPTPVQEPHKDSLAVKAMDREAVLGVLGECHRQVEKNAARFDRIIKEACDERTKEDNMKKMDLDASHCQDFGVSGAKREDTIFCIMDVLGSDNIPKKEEGVTKAWISGKVADYMKKSLDFKSKEKALEPERLFQSVMTGEKWATKTKQLSSSMIAIYGAVVMVALFALIAVGWRTRNTQQSMQPDEMLMVNE